MMKPANKIKIFLLIACVLCALLFACENPWMAEILQEKTITFDSNGGSPVPSQKLFIGEPVKEPAAPSRQGFVFDGWYEDNGTFDKPYDFNFIPVSNMTLYAKWREETSDDSIIQSVNIQISGPATGYAQITEAPTGGTGYTCSSVTWDQSHGTFNGNTIYTATVTLTATGAYKFSDKLTAKINGYDAEKSNLTEKSITLSYTFARTGDRKVIGISIIQQPKLDYTYGDTLDLTNLKVSLTYDGNSTHEDVIFIGNTKNITASPSHGDSLYVNAHNGNPVEVTLGITVETDKLTVNKKNPEAEDFTISNLIQTIGNVTAVSINNKTGKSDGTITIYYSYGNLNSENLPTKAGSYPVTFDVGKSTDDNWDAATGLQAGTLVISDIFTNDTDLNNYLSKLPDNNADTPENIKIGINSEAELIKIANVLGNINKYVNLDLSGSSITSINDFAFKDCQNLVEIIIPNNVTSIKNYAFYNCTNLTSVNIPDNVTSIKDYAFYNCTSLTSVNIPDNVTSIGIDAFGFTSLTSVTIPNNVISIGERTFANCYSLTSVNIGERVESIGVDAFSECKNLTSIIIPSSVKSIGKQAFAGCNLTSVTFEGTINSSSFSVDNSFPSGLRAKFYAEDPVKGTPGTYTRSTTTGTDTDTWTYRP
jgi:uncharacterized repeat protein (TIGR02543 family)